MSDFALYLGIDYSGAETPTSRLENLQVYAAHSLLAVRWLGARTRQVGGGGGVSLDFSQSLCEGRPDGGRAGRLCRGALAGCFAPPLTDLERATAEREGWNKHYTLKTSPMKREDLDEFVACYNPANRHERKATYVDEAAPHPSPLPGSGERGPNGRWRAYDYDELIARDKASPDIFWLRDDALADSDNLPPPDVIAQEIVDDLEAALEQFRLIASDIESKEVIK